MSIFCLGYTPYILKFENQDLTCNQGVENCREVSYYIQLKDCSEKYCKILQELYRRILLRVKL